MENHTEHNSPHPSLIVDGAMELSLSFCSVQHVPYGPRPLDWVGWGDRGWRGFGVYVEESELSRMGKGGGVGFGIKSEKRMSIC